MDEKQENKKHEDDEHNIIKFYSTEKRRTTAEEDSGRPRKKRRKDTRDAAPAPEPEDESSESEYAPRATRIALQVPVSEDDAVESGHVPKATCYATPVPGSKDEGFEVEHQSFYNTPVTKRPNVHSGLESEGKTLANDMEQLIKAEARGVTRKDVPLDIFASMYLQDFIQMSKSNLATASVKKIGQGNWEESEFGERLRKALPTKVRPRQHSSPGYILTHSEVDPFGP